MGLLRVSWPHAPIPSLCNVHLSKIYKHIATDKYLMHSASEERCYFYSKNLHSLVAVGSTHPHTMVWDAPGQGPIG